MLLILDLLFFFSLLPLFYILPRYLVFLDFFLYTYLFLLFRKIIKKDPFSYIVSLSFTFVIYNTI